MEKNLKKFSQSIEAARTAESVPDTVETISHPSGSQLTVRLRGCFVSELELVDKTNNSRVDILYCSPDLTVSKLTASHIMSPVGPSEGLGGQHGFARWASYEQSPQPDGPNGEKQTSFKAKRGDGGIGVTKLFNLGEDNLITETTLTNPEGADAHTSLGEHLYFNLKDEIFDGLTVNGLTLDELLGEGSLQTIKSGEAIFWPGFNGSATITFPAGYNVEIKASSTGTNTDEAAGMLVWHKPDSSSICFEPTIGLEAIGDNEHLVVPAHGEVTLTTSIKLI